MGGWDSNGRHRGRHQGFLRGPCVEIVVTGFLLSLSLCLDLGAVNVAMLHTGLKAGPKPAFLLGVGSCVGDLCYAGAAALGLSFILDYVIIGWMLWIGGTLALALFFSGFFVGGLAWSLCMAMLSGRGGKFIGPQLRRYCGVISAVIFASLACKVAIDGYHTLL